jgi:hypothetical protein
VQRTRLGLALLVSATAGACGGSSEAPDLARCRELEPAITAEAAWEDIGALREDTEEWLALGCEDLLGGG